MNSRFLIPVLLLFAAFITACAPQATPTTEPAVVPTEAMEEPTATSMPEPTATPEPEPTATPEPEPQTIVDIAVADGRFTTLVTAVQAAGLVDALSADGSLTVFAPTDDAFAALPEGTVEALLADLPALSNILLYHVVEGKVMVADVVGLNAATTLLGEDVTITVEGDTVKINDATMIITDIEASNGVIHVIDTVLLPPAPEPAMLETDIVDTAIADGRFTTLVTALQAAGLVDALKAEGPFTVFAPTDDAFAALPEGTIEALLADLPTLSNILLYHVVEGQVLAADVVNLTSAPTLLGEDLTITVEDGVVKINDATVVITDIVTANGVIHVIDMVLLPPAN